MNIFSYLWGYFETNHFTLILLVFLLLLTLVKRLGSPDFLTSRRALFFILLLGVALRVGWIFFSSHAPQTQWGPGVGLESDVANIHAIELSQKGIWFHDGEGNPSGRRPIGYPVFLAALYRVFGVHTAVPWTAHLLLFVAAAYLLYLMARLAFSERAAVLATFVFSVYPVSIFSVKLLTDEHLFLPLFFGGLFLLLKAMRDGFSRWTLVWLGLLFGYATMTRTHPIFMPFVVALACRLSHFSWKKVLGAFFVVLVVMQLLNLPWVIRNYKVWGVPILYTATSGYVYDSFNVHATPEGGAQPLTRADAEFSEEVEKARLSGNAGEYNAACSRALTRSILQHPLRSLNLGIKRLLVFMGWNRAGVWPLWFQFSPGAYDPARPIPQELRDFLEETAYAFYYVLFFSFVFGLIFIARKWSSMPEIGRKCFWVLAACFLFWCAEQMIIFPDRKYRFPLEPLMLLPAAYFWQYLLFDFRWKRR